MAQANSRELLMKKILIVVIATLIFAGNIFAGTVTGQIQTPSTGRGVPNGTSLVWLGTRCVVELLGKSHSPRLQDYLGAKPGRQNAEIPHALQRDDDQKGHGRGRRLAKRRPHPWPIRDVRLTP